MIGAIERFVKSRSVDISLPESGFAGFKDAQDGMSSPSHPGNPKILRNSDSDK
jgi:hypothetical protein